MEKTKLINSKRRGVDQDENKMGWETGGKISLSKQKRKKQKKERVLAEKKKKENSFSLFFPFDTNF